MARRGSRSFSIDASGLIANVVALEPRVDAALGAVCERLGDQATAYMKVNAPWTDRTTLARSSLGSVVFKRATRWYVNLFGGAPYQIYLETKFNGRDAIIGPTILLFGPRLMAMTSGLIDRLRARGAAT